MVSLRLELHNRLTSASFAFFYSLYLPLVDCATLEVIGAAGGIIKVDQCGALPFLLSRLCGCSPVVSANVTATPQKVSRRVKSPEPDAAKRLDKLVKGFTT